MPSSVMQRRDGYPVVIMPSVAYFTKLTWRLRQEYCAQRRN
jgi:hypothetical protein